MVPERRSTTCYSVGNVCFAQKRYFVIYSERYGNLFSTAYVNVTVVESGRAETSGENKHKNALNDGNCPLRRYGETKYPWE